IIGVLNHFIDQVDCSSAHALVEKCVHIIDSTYGADSAESIAALRQMIQTNPNGDLSSLEQELGTLLRVKKKLGIDDQEVIGLLERMAQTLYDRHQYRQSLDVIQELKLVARKVEGDDVLKRVIAPMLAGHIYEMNKRHGDAEREFLQALGALEPMRG